MWGIGRAEEFIVFNSYQTQATEEEEARLRRALPLLRRAEQFLVNGFLKKKFTCATHRNLSLVLF